MMKILESNPSRVFIISIVVFLSSIRILAFSNSSFISNDGFIYLLLNVLILYFVIQNIFIYKIPSLLILILILKIYQIFISIIVGIDLDLGFFVRSLFPELLMTLILFSTYSYRINEKLINIFTYVLTPILIVIFFRENIDTIINGITSGFNSVYWLVFMVPFILILPRRRIKTILLLAIILSIVLSFKTTALLAVLIALIVYLFINNDYKINSLRNIRGIIVPVFVIIFIFFFFSSTSFWLQKVIFAFEYGGSGRFDIWRNALYTIFNSSVFLSISGHGYNTIINSIGFSSHNDFIEILYSFGFIGLLFYLLIYFFNIKMYQSMKRNNYVHSAAYIVSLLIFGIVSLFSHIYFMDYAYLPLMFWAYNIGKFLRLGNRL